MIYPFFKRVIDVLFSAIGIVLLLPLLTLLTILGSCKFGFPFYLDLRAGYKNKLFKVIKFKTMTDGKGGDGALLPDEVRLTHYGAFLRALSLDEIPQLINVFLGQMSLIGPRPLFHDYLGLYSPEQMRRHEVRPGVTGWAQINGRNQLSWEEKFKLDVWYVDNMSVWLDCKIFFLTIKKVLLRDGISSNSSVTMEPFRGNNFD